MERMSVTGSMVLALRAFKLATAALIVQEEAVGEDPKQYHDHVSRAYDIEGQLGFVTIDMVRKIDFTDNGRKRAIITVKAELERQGTSWQRTVDGDVSISFHDLDPALAGWEADMVSASYAFEPAKHTTIALRTLAFYPKAPL